MLSQVYVDGFKSLTKFTLDLQPGLNILVGPNGSGKTNIISFFEFLGNLQDMSISDAISKAGGAGSIFTKVGENQYRSNLICSVTGNIKIGPKKIIFYRYSFTISIDDSFESIIYEKQRLEVKYRTVTTKSNAIPKDMDLDVMVNMNSSSDKPSTKIQVLDLKKITLRYIGQSAKSETNKNRIIEELITERVGADESLVECARMAFEDFMFISNDLHGGKVYNVVPSRARTPEDSAKAPGIDSDGSGLYATLYAIKKHEKQPKKRTIFMPRMRSTFSSKVTLANILSYTQLANGSISQIDVQNNPFDNQLQIRIGIGEEDKSTILPLSSMSDGTIKWLSLITIILTTRFIYSVEEPENYLHPLMQSEILKVMRDSVCGERFILLSTHSETLLNNATPEEVIVVAFRDGRTIANRPSNGPELSREIRETGFGLGYYYISGSLDNE